ncbi:MAG: hypothetical protein JWM64_2812 [Frankiales bacterium]|nr:hypothetical protein [Frankiales bacterium]
MKVPALRREDTCANCHRILVIGTEAAWDKARRQTRCLPCHEQAANVQDLATPSGTSWVPIVAPPAAQQGGASAQREYEKRSSRHEQQIRSRHPRLGGLLLALTQEPTSTRVWAQGAAGERAVAQRLDALAEEDVVALHDRRMRRPDGKLSRANIDHLAVTPAGVWVIDAKTHQGALEVRRSGGLFGPRVEALYINGRNRTALVHGLLEQVAAIRRELAAVEADVEVRGALCFVGTELPWFGSSSIIDVPLVGRRGLAKLLRAPGDLDATVRETVGTFLDQRFPPAA